MFLHAFTCILATMPAYAQSIWDTANLEKVKQQIEQPAYHTAYNALLERAEEALKQPNLSVMMKEKTAISGNKHDYYSQARYFWPDPAKPDGKPYISRDGISNPELNKLDRNRLGSMADNVTALSLAWYFSNDERYAQKAVEQLQYGFSIKKPS